MGPRYQHSTRRRGPPSSRAVAIARVSGVAERSCCPSSSHGTPKITGFRRPTMRRRELTHSAGALGFRVLHFLGVRSSFVATRSRSSRSRERLERRAGGTVDSRQRRRQTRGARRAPPRTQAGGGGTEGRAPRAPRAPRASTVSASGSAVSLQAGTAIDPGTSLVGRRARSGLLADPRRARAACSCSDHRPRAPKQHPHERHRVRHAPLGASRGLGRSSHPAGPARCERGGRTGSGRASSHGPKPRGKPLGRRKLPLSPAPSSRQRYLCGAGFSQALLRPSG